MGQLLALAVNQRPLFLHLIILRGIYCLATDSSWGNKNRWLLELSPRFVISSVITPSQQHLRPLDCRDTAWQGCSQIRILGKKLNP